jgi:hypothetical protein
MYGWRFHRQTPGDYWAAEFMFVIMTLIISIHTIASSLSFVNLPPARTLLPAQADHLSNNNALEEECSLYYVDAGSRCEIAFPLPQQPWTAIFKALRDLKSGICEAVGDVKARPG